jgi:hypothetical protein
MWPKDVLGKVRKGNRKIQEKMDAPTLKKELTSFRDYLHFVLIKILRDREPKMMLVVPSFKEGYNIVIQVQRIPLGMKPSDQHFILDEDQLARAITHPTDIEEVLHGEEAGL